MRKDCAGINQQLFKLVYRGAVILPCSPLPLCRWKVKQLLQLHPNNYQPDKFTITPVK